MSLKRLFVLAAVCVAALSVLTAGASAAGLEYSFEGAEQPEYYGDTSYEGVYGSQYNYGGINTVDYNLPELPYGKNSNTSIGQMEKVQTASPEASAGSTGLISGSEIYPGNIGAENIYPIWTPTAFTSASELTRFDGSIGILQIPSLSISMKVWEGETNDSMAKGLGHYSSTSGWDGNVGICGHNRGAKYVIGGIKDLKLGDTIKYTTNLGTRTYAVTFVGTISYTDWSYLGATSDNRITITTCLANQPTVRICVQAIEVAA